MILEEVSFVQEVQNLEEFSSVYKYENIKFPTAYKEYCSDSVIVMSFEHGFRFDDKENIFKHKIDFKKLISSLVNFYTDQMLVNGYFHADPHPGNLLVDTSGNLIMIDFGMVKRVPNYMRVAIIELLKAANEKNYELYISASKRMGTVAYEAPESELAQFTSRMFEIFGNDNLTSESMQQLAFEVLESTRDLPFKLPSDAIYILRVSAIIEGLGTTYIENFNGVKDILPILQDNMPKALGVNDSILEALIDEIKDLPLTAHDFKISMKKLSEGSIDVEISKNQLGYIGEELQSYFDKKSFSFALILGGIFILLYNPEYKDIAAVIFAFGFFRLIYN
jgi:predicted unusual protein kinase regulating ubiquinone biosynthesis (AarF/ABC1/UbiB family)